jgi:hypothetical protein
MSIIYTWKILEISAKNEIITHAKYQVIAKNKDNFVENEGNWWFQFLELKVPFADVTEEMVVSWIEKETTKDGINLIKSRLEEQLNVLEVQENVVAPWLPQVFIPNI